MKTNEARSQEPGAGSQGATLMEAPVMEEVFAKLNLPEELKGATAAVLQNNDDREVKAAAEAKAKAPADAGRTPELNEEQRTWLETQLAATTSEELEAARTAAEEGKPELTEEEGKWVEEQLATKAEQLATPAGPELTEEQRTWVDEQLAARDEEVTAARTEAEEARTKAKELEERLTKGQEVRIAVAPIHPLFLEDDAGKISAIDGQYAAFEKWALANWDGTEEQADEKGKVIAPAYSKEQIRTRYAEVKEARDRIVPAALQAVQVRKQQEQAARKAYPELFDAKRPEYALLEQILRTAPGLKAVFPNIHVIIGDAIVGERVRLEKAKNRNIQHPTSNIQKKTGKPTPPKAGPGAGGVTAKPAPSKGKGGEVSAARFQELGGNREALVTMLRTVDLPTGRE